MALLMNKQHPIDLKLIKKKEKLITLKKKLDNVSICL